MGVHNCKKLSSWMGIIFSAIGVEGDEKVVGGRNEGDKSMDERSFDNRDFPIAGTAIIEPVLRMRSRRFRDVTRLVLGNWSTGGTGRGKEGGGGSGGRNPCGGGWTSSCAGGDNGDPGMLCNVARYPLSLDDRRRDDL